MKRPFPENLLESHASRVLFITHKIKNFGHELARAYTQGSYDELISRLRDYYGELPTYAYEEPSIDPSYYAPRTVLAALIAERIALRYKGFWKHITVAIIGVGGSGKTTYSILSGIGALMLWGKSFSEAVKIASMLTFFQPKPFLETVKALLEERKWVPFVILDDVGAQISKYWVWLGELYWSYFFSVLDQLKDWCGTLILTARSERSIPARMREIVDIVIQASETEVGGYIVDLMRFYRRDDYERRKTRIPIYVDGLIPTLKMPNELWEAMTEARRETGMRRVSMTLEMIEIQGELERMKLEKLKERLEKGERRKAENA